MIRGIGLLFVLAVTALCAANLVGDACECPNTSWVEHGMPDVWQSETAIFDLLYMIGEWGDCNAAADCCLYYCPGDLNCDGVVDIEDLLIYLENWQ